LGILFISHSSRDNEAALKVRNWLRQRGWGDVFLDLDPQLGLAPGHRWQQELKQAGERCSGVLVLLSPNWIASRWCQTEFLLADQLGKRIFPVSVEPMPFDDLPLELKAKFQIVDISVQGTEAEGFERLAIGLKRAGLDPRSFEWPPASDPHRLIYRGLQSLDEQDAAIFFGRDALITKGLDALRRMRDGAPERMLAILGASGAGKSSFLKAGLIARLKRDEENFLVLPVIRPERAALSGERGLAVSLSCDPAALSGAEQVQAAFARIRESVVERFKRFAERGRETYESKPPMIVLPIDQAEELFAAENLEAAHALDLLAKGIRADANAVIVATIRSDSFEKLQSEPCLADLPVLPFSLATIPHGAFKDVIECPARLASPPITIDADLTDQLLEDLAADDALPLLAFTLERLLYRGRGRTTMTLVHYAHEMGGLQGAISAAVESAFAAASRDSALPDDRGELEKLARTAFIPALVQLDDIDAEPRRRVERLNTLPQAARALVRHMIDERLLICDRSTIDGVETDTVEVAHEAILRQWPALKSWIAEERDALRALDGVRAAAAEWRKHAGQNDRRGHQSWLVHRGGRLQEAEALLTRAGFTSALGFSELEYLATCRADENAERLRERLGFARTRRLHRNIGILIALAAIVVLLAGIGIAQLLAGMRVQASDTLTAQAAKASESGYYDRGARYALAGLTGADSPFAGPYGSRAEPELQGAASASSALAVLRGHDDMVLGASFSPDGSRIVTASQDRTARIWNANTGRLIAILRGHKRQVFSATFSPDSRRIVTASADKTARLWDAATAREIDIFRGHEDAVVTAVFSPDGKRIVTASRDDTARVWDVSTGRQIGILRGHQDQLESAAFSADGARIVTASDDKTARIWDAGTGRCIAILRGHESPVASAEFSPDGRRIVTASSDGTARIWDAESGRQIGVLRGHEDAVTSAAYNSDGMRIVTASHDKTARIWDAGAEREIVVLRGHDDVVNSAAFSRDGTRIVTASDDKTARIWDANAANHVLVLSGQDDAVNSAAFSPDGKRIVTASTDKTARTWDAGSGRELAILRGHGDIVETVAFSPDGTRIVSASDDKTARIWEAGSGRLLAILHGHQDFVYGAAFSPNGKRIVTASTDGTARIWDAGTARVLTVLRGHTRGLISAGFSPDGRRVVTASGDGTARIWDAETGRGLTVLRGHEGGVSSAMFSPDGTRIVTAGRDRTARVWDANTGRELAVFRGHEDVVLGAAFSSDGKRIVTASQDKTARLWDAGTGTEIAVLRGHAGQVESAAFSPDGRRVITASDDKTARIWNVSTIELTAPAELVRRACGTSLAHGLSEFSARERLHDAPVLDPRLDTDACHPPSLWARLGRIFWAGFSD
jgi:WD40 repeat protein